MTQVNTPFIAASGWGEATRMPDRATISVAIRATDKDSPDPAAKEVAEGYARVLAALRSLNIDAKQAQSERYQVGRMIVQRGHNDFQGDHFVNHTFNVVVEDIAAIGTVVDAIRQAGAFAILGVTFAVVDAEEARQEAIATATRIAVARARSIADASGHRLGRMLALGTPEALAAFQPAAPERHSMNDMAMHPMMFPDRGEAPAIGANIVPAPLRVQATVHGSWALENTPA